MTKTADVNDVAAHFTDWLKEVAAGHELVVTQNNRPVARVVGPAPASEPARHTPSFGE
jgi:prevent-host-death family protein